MTGQSETKHTPGELHVVKSDTLFMLESDEGMRVARTSWHGSIRNPYPLRDEAAANAARIALTWNCHDELVAACQAVVDACTSAPPMDLIKRLGECADKCAAALAKASA